MNISSVELNKDHEMMLEMVFQMMDISSIFGEMHVSPSKEIQLGKGLEFRLQTGDCENAHWTCSPEVWSFGLGFVKISYFRVPEKNSFEAHFSILFGH